MTLLMLRKEAHLYMDHGAPRSQRAALLADPPPVQPLVRAVWRRSLRPELLAGMLHIRAGG